MSATIRSPGEGELLVNLLGAKVLIRITGKETGGQYALIEAEQPPNSPPAPLHIHDREDETIQVLEGRLIVEIEGREHDAPDGALSSFLEASPSGSGTRIPALAATNRSSLAGQEDYFRTAYALNRSDIDYEERLAEIRSRFGLRYPSRAGRRSDRRLQSAPNGARPFSNRGSGRDRRSCRRAAGPDGQFLHFGFARAAAGQLPRRPRLPDVAAVEGNARRWRSILGSHQEEVARKFARSGEDKFKGVAYEISAHGNPLIEGAVAAFECASFEQIAAGDHTIVILKIIGI